MNLYRQILYLDRSLGEFAPVDKAPQQLIDLFNVLLDEAKNVKADHLVVSSIDPVPEHGMGQSINAGGLRGLTQQLLAAFNDD